MKTTYLLGAGASANAIPVVENIRDALNEILRHTQILNTTSNTLSTPLFGQEIPVNDEKKRQSNVL